MKDNNANGVSRPACAKARPKAHPTILLPQQRCKVDGYRDPRPRGTELHRCMWGMQCSHRTALVREEEKGYAKGLRDGMREAVQVDAPLPPQRWPFVETPGEFTGRLMKAYDEFGTMLAAVRYVLIESPAVFADRRQRATEQPDATGVLRKERKAVIDLLDEYIPPNGEAWDAVNEIRTMMKERADK